MVEKQVVNMHTEEYVDNDEEGTSLADLLKGFKF